MRTRRLAKGLGLLDVAKACGCSVQFVSNIEHGRAPLPWDKVPQIASVLRIREEELQAANLAVRSDFRSFVTTTGGRKRTQTPKVLGRMAGTASAVAAAAKDSQLQDLIQRYTLATPKQRKEFLRSAAAMLQ